MKKINTCLSLLLLLTSCNNAVPIAQKPMPRSSAATPDSTRNNFTTAMVHNKKDFSCGMPLTAGLEDTCHFKGKAYGFCSKECKEEFLKNPSAYLTTGK